MEEARKARERERGGGGRLGDSVKGKRLETRERLRVSEYKFACKEKVCAQCSSYLHIYSL